MFGGKTTWITWLIVFLVAPAAFIGAMASSGWLLIPLGIVSLIVWLATRKNWTPEEVKAYNEANQRKRVKADKAILEGQKSQDPFAHHFPPK
jgi:hypothetical protein